MCNSEIVCNFKIPIKDDPPIIPLYGPGIVTINHIILEDDYEESDSDSEDN